MDSTRFTGPYARQSEAYMDSYGCAAIPLIYKPEIIHFTINTNGKPMRFKEGQPVTITIGRYGLGQRGMGYAFYGVIRQVVSYEPISRSRVIKSIFAEIHTVPGHCLDWPSIDAAIWTRPPPHIRFVQPHAFLELWYQSFNYCEERVPIVHLTSNNVDPVRWQLEDMEHGVERAYIHPPPFGYYPSHPPRVIKPHPCPLLLPSPTSITEGYEFDPDEWLGTAKWCASFHARTSRIDLCSMNEGQCWPLENGIKPNDIEDNMEADPLYQEVFQNRFVLQTCMRHPRMLQ